MGTQFVRQIKMTWFYPIVAAIVLIGVFLFAAMYSGGGAEVLNTPEPSETPEAPITTAVQTQTPEPIYTVEPTETPVPLGTDFQAETSSPNPAGTSGLPEYAEPTQYDPATVEPVSTDG